MDMHSERACPTWIPAVRYHRHRVKINVRGASYETYESTLRRYPNTLLGNQDQRNQFYDYRRNEYYFDCKSEIFDSILFFYQTGILARPCFSKQKEYHEVLQFFGIVKRKALPPTPVDLRTKIWAFFENPHHSKFTEIIAYLTFAVILASVATICIETEVDGKPTLHRFNSVWFCLECFYILFFSVEYAIRLYGAPNRKQFLRSCLGIIDILAIAPFYIAMIAMALHRGTSIHSAVVIRVLRLIQILRIVKLARYSSGLQILSKSLYCCKDQIISLAAFFVIAVIFSSSIVYMFEDISDTGVFTDIPSTMWFSIITMTTVGYGDVVPKSVMGKIAATISIFMGTVILFYLFLPIYLMYFTFFYTSAETERKDQTKLEAEQKAAKRKQLEDTKILYLKQIKTRTAMMPMDDKLELTVAASYPNLSNTSYLEVDVRSNSRRGSTRSLYM